MDKNKSDLVSIIIPAYNAERYILDCVTSIINQTYTNMQVLVIDDGSTDQTKDVLTSIANYDARVTVISKENGGVSSARNYGIKVSNGNYICFVDSDDILPPDSIEVLVNAINEKNADVAFGNYSYVYEGKNDVVRIPKFKGGVYNTSELSLIDDGTLSGITFGSVWGALYKASVIRDKSILFREHLRINEDGVFNVEYCLAVTNIAYINKPIYKYRQWKTNKEPNIEQLKKRLDDSTVALRDICADKLISREIVNNELYARELFCVFQLSVVASSLKYRVAIKYYKDIWSEQIIRDSKNILNIKKLSKAKRMLWSLIKNRKYRSFYIAVHYIYPILDKYVKR